MAGFCRNCGTALGDGQAFCVKCGTRVGDVAQANVAAPTSPGAAPPVAAVPPAGGAAPPVAGVPPAAYSAPAQGPPPASSGASALVKILIGVVIVFVVFGALAAGAMIYIGHRVHQKAQEMGLTRSSEELRESNAALRRIDGCALLSKADVGQAVKMEIVRAEAQSGDAPGCTYSVSGDPGELTAKHLASLQRNRMSKADQETMENFSKTVFHGTAATPASAGDHPGEAAVFSYSIDNKAAQLQMRLNKVALGGLGPGITPAIPNLGDEAFDAAGAMLFVRKGDKVVRIMYMTCPCGLDDVLPLARKIVDGL
jgi:zinc-ribbon domain